MSKLAAGAERAPTMMQRDPRGQFGLFGLSGWSAGDDPPPASPVVEPETPLPERGHDLPEADRGPLQPGQHDAPESYLNSVKGSIRIPAGSPERICQKCPALIFWVGKQPVSIDSYKGGPGGFAPTALSDGAGISHYATCPRAGDFRKK